MVSFDEKSFFLASALIKFYGISARSFENVENHSAVDRLKSKSWLQFLIFSIKLRNLDASKH